MIDYKTIVRVQIDDIEEVRVGPIEEGLADTYRIITVHTKHGETFDLVLQSVEAQNIAFQEKEDWLNPKVYTGAMNDGDASA